MAAANEYGWNESYVDVRPRDITEKTRLITLDRPYHPGQGDLIVFYNGGYAVRGKDYNELSPYTLEFLFDLEPPDTLVLHYQKLW